MAATSISEKEKAQIMRAFTYFDTDGSGSINKEEFQELIADLGEVLTEEETAAAMASIDKNSDGDLSFDEFLSWWTSGEHHGSSTGTKAAKLKAKLKTKTYMRKARILSKKITKESAPACAQNGVLSSEFKCTIGDIDIASPDNMVAAATMSSGNADLINSIKAAIGSTTTLAGVLYTLKCRPDAPDEDIEELRSKLEEISGMMVASLPENKPFTPNVKFNVKKEASGTIMEVGVSFDLVEEVAEPAELFSGIISSLIIPLCESKVMCSQKPGAENPPPFAFYAESKFSIDKGVFETARETLEMMDQKKKLRDQIALHNLLKGFSTKLELDFAGPDDFIAWFKKAVIDKDGGLQPDEQMAYDVFTSNPNKWAILRRLLCEITLNIEKVPEDEEEAQMFISLYQSATKCLSGIVSIQSFVGEKSFEVTTTNFDVYGFIPSLADAQAWAATVWQHVHKFSYLDAPYDRGACYSNGYGEDEAEGAWLDLNEGEEGRPAPAGKFLWVHFSHNRGDDPTVALAQMRFKAGDAEVTPTSVEGPGNPANLLDGKKDTAWEDDGAGDRKGSDLVFEFAEPVSLTRMQLVTADGPNTRDPISFHVRTANSKFAFSEKMLLPSM